MLTGGRITTVRLTKEDDLLLKELKRRTGIRSTTDIFRLCMRNALLKKGQRTLIPPTSRR